MSQKSQPEPKPEPGLGPMPHDDNEKRVEDMIDELDMELYVKAIIDEDILKNLILENNFDYEKIKKYITSKYLLPN